MQKKRPVATPARIGSDEAVDAKATTPASPKAAAAMPPPSKAAAKPAAGPPSSATSTPMKSPELKRSKVELCTGSKQSEPKLPQKEVDPDPQQVPSQEPEAAVENKEPETVPEEQTVARTLMGDLDKAAGAETLAGVLDEAETFVATLDKTGEAETVSSSQALTDTVQESDPPGKELWQAATMTTLAWGSESVADLGAVGMDVSLEEFLQGSGDLAAMADSDVQRLVDQWIARRLQAGDLEKFAGPELTAAIVKLQEAEGETVFMLAKKESMDRAHEKAREKVDATVKSMTRHERQRAEKQCPGVKPEDTEAYTWAL